MLQINLARVSASLQADAVKLLRKLERELVAEVASTTWRKTRVEKQLKELRLSIATYYNNVATATTKSAKRVATVVANSTAMGIGTAAVLPATAVLSSVVGDALVLGAPQSAWWAKQSSDTVFKFSAAVRQGMVAADTSQQIVRRVMDVMDVAKHNAAALVQTSIASIANDARMAVYQANDDLIEVYLAVATLDSHTCMECAPLDGLEWEKDGEPIDHDEEMPNYPLHYNCRCLLIGRITREKPGGARASDGGPVSAGMTFSDWLESQSVAKQDSILGPGRAEMYRSGKITLNDLTSGTGRPLSIAELERNAQSA